MDMNNRYETVYTHNFVRIEHVGLLLVLLFLAYTHYESINWYIFSAIFWGIDLIGFYPGIIYYKYINNNVPKVFYVIYNVSHSYVTWIAFSLIWIHFYGLDYTLLAPWAHLMADRGIFGNTLKAHHVAFNIEKNKQFDKFESSIYR